MNLAGLIIAFVGSLFVGFAQWRYGQDWLPLVDMKFIGIEGGKQAEAERIISSTKWAAGIGWAFITAGFLLQMLAAICG
jgi:hypothetical protein